MMVAEKAAQIIGSKNSDAKAATKAEDDNEDKWESPKVRTTVA